MEREPPRPRELNPAVSRDLETICLKCLDKQPHRRYGSAEALAEDLDRWLTGEPIRARPVGPVERAVKWMRRRPALAAVLAVVVASVIGLVILQVRFTRELEAEKTVAVAERNTAVVERKRSEEGEAKLKVQYDRAEAAKRTADEQRKTAEAERKNKEVQLELARQTVYTTQLWRAAGVWDRDSVQGRELLDDLAVCPLDLRDFTWGYYHRLCHWDRMMFHGHTARVSSLMISPDGSLLATGSYDGTVRLWDLATGRQRATLAGHEGKVWSVAFSPDGKTIASGSGDGTVRLWDVAAGKEMHKLKSGREDVRSVAFSPDGKVLAAGGGTHSSTETNSNLRWKKGQVKLWDAATLQELRTLQPGGDSAVACMAFSPDSKTLAAGVTHGSRTVLFDVAGGKEQDSVRFAAGWIHAVAFSPDGKHLAIASADHTVRIWDTVGKYIRATLHGHTEQGFSLSFSSDSKLLASGGGDGLVKLWDVASNRETAVLKGHRGSVNGVSFSRDGRTLVSGADDGLAYLWDLTLRPERSTLLSETHPNYGVSAMALSPDGRLLATGSQDKTVKLWDLAGGQLRATLTGHSGVVTSVALSPDGTMLASASRDKTIKLWDPVTGEELRTLRKHTDATTSVVFTADSKQLVSSGGTDVWLWDVPAGGEPHQVVKLKTVRGMLGIQIVAGEKGIVVQQVIPGGAAAQDKRLKAGDTIVGIVGRDGQLVKTEGLNSEATGKLILGPVDTAVELEVLPAGAQKTVRYSIVRRARPLSIHELAISPDGSTLALAADDASIGLVDLATGLVRASLHGHQAAITSLAFAPDGETLASGSGDATARVWDVATGKPRTVLHGEDRAVLSVAFTPDGRTVALGCADRTVKLWDAATGLHRATLQGHSREVRGVAFSADGRTLVSGSGVVDHGEWVYGGEIKLWDVSVGREYAVLRGHQNGVSSIALSANGLILASVDQVQRAKLWDMKTAQAVGTLEGPTGQAMSLALSPDGGLLAVGSVKNVITLWDTKAGKVLRALQGHTNIVNAVAFSPDGKTLASGSIDGTVRLWDPGTGKERATLRGHAGPVLCVQFDPKGQALVSGGQDGTARFWNVEKGQAGTVLRGHTKTVRGLAFSADGKSLVTGGEDQAVKVWDVATSKEVRTLADLGVPVQGLALAPDGRTLAIVSHAPDRMGAVELWDLPSGQPRRTFTGHLGPITAVLFTPDGRFLVTGSEDNSVRLWDVPALLFDVARYRSAAQELASAGKGPEAEAEFAKALALQPDEFRTWLDRGHARERRGAWADAFADYARAAKLNPQDWSIAGEQARLHGRLKQWPEAVAAYALAAKSKAAPYWLLRTNYTCAVLLANDAAKYREICKQALARPDAAKDGYTALHTARLCVLGPDAGTDPAAALALAKKAVAEKPNTAWYLHTLGLAHYRAGNYQDAVTQFETSLKNDANWGHVVDWLGLAMAYQRLEKPDEAQKWLEKATTWIDRAERDWPAGATTPTGIHINEWLECQLLRREAEALVKKHP
jgi:WD40 repeat protein/Flp pilus assembly protein TadD